MKRWFLVTLLFVLVAVPSHGQNVLKRVAVLEFRNPPQTVSGDDALLIADLMRNAALPALPRDSFLLLTRETMEEMYPPGVTNRRCSETLCELEYGRLIKADYIITGAFARLDDQLLITARVYDVIAGNLLESQVVYGTTVKELKDGLDRIAPILMAAIPGAVVGGAGNGGGGGAVFVTPTGPTTPRGEAGVTEIAPTEVPPATATGPASLYITSNPAGADVYLGSTKAGNTSPAFQMPNLQAGTRVHVTLRLDLYHDVSFDVDLKPGITKFENVALKPAFGSLTITSDPPGAKVLIGGAAVGTTPYANPRYPSGDYLVGLELDQYVPISGQTLSVRDGEATEKAFTLSADFGTLSVESSPPGATVTLAGNPLGTTPGTWRVAPVQNGTLEVALAGYRGKSFAINVDRGQQVTISAAQATLTQKVGSLQVFADPPEPGAKVYLDGKEVGTAPLTLDNIAEGSHEVKVETQEKAGITTVAVTEGQTVVATVTLESRGASGMVRIPAGTFTMGSPSSEPGRDSDETQHTVTISRAFLMGTTEVTQGQWQAVMGSNPSKFSGCGADCPVEQVSWSDVVDFCNRLSDREGLSRCYSGSGNDVSWDRSCTGYRLPTEAEWEYAARSGSTTAFANGGIRELECGNDPSLDRMGWYCGNAGGQTHQVGQKQANAWGLYDMHGNVWEWVWDWKGDYPSGAVTDPVGPSGGSGRVVRGGSWYSLAQYCRSAFRGNFDPGDRDLDLGFRLVRSL